MKRKVTAATALTVVLLVQLTIVNGLALPGGGTPDLLLLCVVALGLSCGRAAGLIAGFWVGLALDLAPPANELAGQYALALCLAGYWSGRLRFTLRHSAIFAIAAAAAMAAVGEAMAAALTLTLDTPEVTWSTVSRVLPASVSYDALLGPLVLLCWVRCAVALGVSIDPRDDSPALETGGSAAPVSIAGGAAGAARPVPRQAGQRLAIAGDSRAAASGRWLVGDVAEAAPAVGAIGWLTGPVRSRRARREQARLTAMVTGATPRKGAFWVGRRPPGLVPVQPQPPARTRGLERLRPGSGVAGTAATRSRPGPGLARRPVRLALADQRRTRAGAGRSGRLAAGLLGGREPHGTGGHGVSGPGLPSIGFGRFVPRAGPAHVRAVPKIAFGAGSLPGGSGPARAGQRRVPRIAFGTGGVPAAGGPAGRRVPRIAFGTGSQAGAGQAAVRRVPRIAFTARPAALAEPVGGGGTGAGRTGLGPMGLGRGGIGRGIGGTGIGRGGIGWVGIGRMGLGRGGAGRAGDARIGRGPLGARRHGTPRLGLAAHRIGAAQPRPSLGAARFASGPWLAGSAGVGCGHSLAAEPGGAPAATGHLGASARGRPVSKIRRPKFQRSGSALQVPGARRPKAARMSAGRRSFRHLPWLRRAGDRSTVWRIGSRRTGGYR